MVNKLIQTALDEVGYLEKAGNKQLDSKTANVGSGNFTKYARDLDAQKGFYNTPKQGFPWCDVFVDWCFVQAFGVEKAMELLCQPGKSLGAGCGYSARYYKSKGQFHNDPKPGDQIFFLDSVGDVAHTGIVYKVDNHFVYTVEGNTSTAAGVVGNGGGVFKKSYAINYNRIYGYGRPDYDSVAPAQTEAIKKSDFSLEMRVLKNGCEGDDVRALQNLLISNKCPCGIWGADRNFGAATEAAVRKYQKENKLQVDGKAGPATMGKLLGVK